MAILRQRACSWCSTLSNDPLQISCSSCGGPLPALPLRLLRENPELVVTDADFAAIAPGPGPRVLPAGYFGRHLVWENFGCAWGSVPIGIGLLFFVISWPLMCAFFPLGVIFLLVSLLTIGIGMAAAFIGMVHPWRRLMALRSGLYAEGKVVDVSEGVWNGAPGYTITYVFETVDGVHQGQEGTADWMAGQREEGERVWVVYRPNAVHHNAIWPPV